MSDGSKAAVDNAQVIVVNLTSAPGALGGAVLAAQLHSQHMAEHLPVELWRMWDKPGSEQLGKLPVRNFPCRVKYGAIGRQLPMLAKKVLLESDIPSMLRRQRPRIVHLQNPSPALEFERIARLCRAMGSKVVASTHGFQEIFDPKYGFDKLHHKIGWRMLLSGPLQRAFDFVDAFLIGFPAQEAFLNRLGVPSHKMHLVPNGIDPAFKSDPDPDEIRKTAQKFGLTSGSPVLLFMGNHTHNKGLGMLMELAATLPVPATVVVGGKLLSGEPEKWTGGLKLPPHVKILFTDFLSVPEQRSLYHLAKVFVFPSISETLPLVVLEAMAAGLPTVAFDVGGISYQLEEGAGIAVPLGDFSRFRSEVLSLLADEGKHRRTGQAARARQAELFTWDIVAQKTMQVYQGLL